MRKHLYGGSFGGKKKRSFEQGKLQGEIFWEISLLNFCCINRQKKRKPFGKALKKLILGPEKRK